VDKIGKDAERNPTGGFAYDESSACLFIAAEYEFLGDLEF